MNTGTCQSCGASIIWAKSPKGRRIPLDPEKFATGTIQLNDDGSCVVLTGDALLTHRGEAVPLYRSHFASCTFAEAHRKSKAKA